MSHLVDLVLEGYVLAADACSSGPELEEGGVDISQDEFKFPFISLVVVGGVFSGSVEVRVRLGK